MHCLNNNLHHTVVRSSVVQYIFFFLLALSSFSKVSPTLRLSFIPLPFPFLVLLFFSLICYLSLCLSLSLARYMYVYIHKCGSGFNRHLFVTLIYYTYVGGCAVDRLFPSRPFFFSFLLHTQRKTAPRKFCHRRSERTIKLRQYSLLEYIYVSLVRPLGQRHWREPRFR